MVSRSAQGHNDMHPVIRSLYDHAGVCGDIHHWGEHLTCACILVLYLHGIIHGIILDECKPLL